MVTLESPASSIALKLPGSRWAEFESFGEEFFMPRCGATFDENIPP